MKLSLIAATALAATTSATSSSVSVLATPTSTPYRTSLTTASSSSYGTFSVRSSSSFATSTSSSSTSTTSSSIFTTSSTTSTSSTTIKADKTCTAGDTSSTEGVQALLDSTGSVDWLNIMFLILPDGETDWVNHLWTTVFPNEGASPLGGCSDIGGDCSPDTLCSDYSTDMAYWVFHEIAVLHSKINTVHDKLQWEGWLDGLSIDQIAKDFTTVSPSSDWAKWISAAFSMAGGFATGIDLNKQLRGMIGFASAGLTDVSLTSVGEDKVDTTSVENTLKNIVGAAGDYVASILSNATGNGDSSTLPIYTDTTLEFATARFLDDNTILLDENTDNSSFIAAFDNFADNIEKKLVDEAMKTAWYVLVGEDDVDEKDCTMTGAYYLEATSDKYWCFYLTHPSDTSDCENNDPSTCVSDAWEAPYNDNNKMSTNVYTKLTDTYGFDLETYYTSLIDCYINGDGTVDLSATTNNGTLPRCFYTLPTRRAHWADDGTALLELVFYGSF